MDAFNQVLAAEQEAERSIEAARNEAAVAVAAAKTNQELRLKAEITRLEELELATLTAHKGHINGLVGKIHTEAQVKVAALEKRFADHRSNLKSSLKNSF